MSGFFISNVPSFCQQLGEMGLALGAALLDPCHDFFDGGRQLALRRVKTIAVFAVVHLHPNPPLPRVGARSLFAHLRTDRLRERGRVGAHVHLLSYAYILRMVYILSRGLRKKMKRGI